MRRRPQGEGAIGLGDRERTVGFERHRRDPLVYEPGAHHDVVVEEQLVADVMQPTTDDVGAVVGEQQGRIVGGRVERPDCDRQRLDVHDDGFGGIDRGLVRRRHDDRHRFTDEPDSIDGEQRPSQRTEQLASLMRQPEVVRRQCRDDTGHRRRRLDVDPEQSAVRNRAPGEDRVQQSFDFEVSHEPGLAGQQRRVLHPPDLVAEHRPRHREEDKAYASESVMPAEDANAGRCR